MPCTNRLRRPNQAPTPQKSVYLVGPEAFLVNAPEIQEK
jgi:hypothetical protein